MINSIFQKILYYISWFSTNLYKYMYGIFIWIPTLFEGINYNIDHLPLHLLILSIIIATSIFVYIKIKYPFWSTQPVYHTYDFWRRWFNNPGLIQPGYPYKTRFYKSHRIQTFDFLDLSEIQKKQTVDLIQSYSIPEESALYMFHLGNLDTYMTGHTYPTFISLYYEEAFIRQPKSIINPTIVSDETIIEIVKKPIGCITSRSIDLFFYDNNNTNNTNNGKSTVYFLDFITVNREKGSINPNISRELIHTHEYNQRRSSLDNSNLNSKTINISENTEPIQISLFKKESGLSEGIVPLVSYSSYMVYIKNTRLRKLPPHFILVPIHRRNIQILMDFIEISKINYECFGIAEIANLSALIHGGLLKVYIIQRGKEVYAAYFFRDSRTQFDSDMDDSYPNNTNGALLILCGSIRNTKSLDLFYMGFLQSLRNILRENNIFKLLLIEGVSQNIEIYERYIGKINNNNNNNKKDNIIGENPSAYYLFNYFYPKQPFSPKKCFMVF